MKPNPKVDMGGRIRLPHCHSKAKDKPPFSMVPHRIERLPWSDPACRTPQTPEETQIEEKGDKVIVTVFNCLPGSLAPEGVWGSLFAKRWIEVNLQALLKRSMSAFK